MSVPCPTCGQECATENGIKNHHAQVHDESLVLEDYECTWCGDTFEDYPSQQKLSNEPFCSNECRGNWQSVAFSKEGNPVFTGLVTLECARCGHTRKVTKGEANKDYGDHGYDYEDHHEISRCVDCEGESEHLDRIPFSSDWQEKREKVRERDNQECRWCGIGNDEHIAYHGQSLHVHHIEPRSQFFDMGKNELSDEADNPDNLITLCKMHHEEAESGELSKERMEELVTESNLWDAI